MKMPNTFSAFAYKWPYIFIAIILVIIIYLTRQESETLAWASWFLGGVGVFWAFKNRGFLDDFHYFFATGFFVLLAYSTSWWILLPAVLAAIVALLFKRNWWGLAGETVGFLSFIILNEQWLQKWI